MTVDHAYGASVDLSNTCLRCGKRTTLLAMMSPNYPQGECTGTPTKAVPTSLNTPTRCECGAASSGSKIHSSWCPVK